MAARSGDAGGIAPFCVPTFLQDILHILPYGTQDLRQFPTACSGLVLSLIACPVLVDEECPAVPAGGMSDARYYFGRGYSLR